MKLATQDKPFFPENIDEKFKLAKSIGFDAFEIDGKLLLERFEEVKQAVTNTGLAVSTACGGYEGWIGDFDEVKRLNGVQEICSILRSLSEIGGQGIVVPAAWGMFSKRLPPHHPPRNDKEDKIVLLESLTEINRVAKETNTFLYLEPLNRYEDHMLNTLNDAIEIIKSGNFSNVKVIADFFHMNIEEANIYESILHAKEFLGHVHLADSHRYQPGDGHLDFINGFNALKEIDYQGYYAFECRVKGQDELLEYKKSVKYIKSLFEK